MKSNISIINRLVYGENEFKSDYFKTFLSRVQNDENDLKSTVYHTVIVHLVPSFEIFICNNTSLRLYNDNAPHLHAGNKEFMQPKVKVH